MNRLRSAAGLLLAAQLLAACDPTDAPARLVGQLESDRVELVTEFAEPIVARPVVEGQQVAANDVLLRLDDRRASARLKELEAALEQQRARLDELTRGPRQEQIDAERANVAGARQELDFRRVEYGRAKDVFERRLAAPDSLDRAKVALDSAAAALESREARLAELLAGTTVEELRQAESAVAAAEARVDAARIDRERHTIVAPVAGIVDSLLFEIGERPPLGAPAVVLLAGQQPYARAYVPEGIRASVRVGDAVQVHVDGVPQTVDGRVRWVASDATFTPYFALTERDRGRLSFLAKIDLDLDAGQDRLPDGLPIDVVLAGEPAASENRIRRE